MWSAFPWGTVVESRNVKQDIKQRDTEKHVRIMGKLLGIRRSGLHDYDTLSPGVTSQRTVPIRTVATLSSSGVTWG